MTRSTPRLVVAGTHSGCGKTTVASGLMALLTGMGKRVQGIKAGPDYIDGGYHRSATGRPPRNLDTWMMSERAVVDAFRRTAGDADIAIIEGVMGLFDGQGDGELGSTAHLAKVLRAPVILVIDSRGLGRSAAAIVRGYQRFDPEVQLAGVFLNGVGSARHAKLLRQAIEGQCGIPVVGYLGKRPELAVARRHLGIHGVEDGGQPWPARWAQALAGATDVDALVELAASAGPISVSPSPGPVAKTGRARVGVARDAAFRFYYEDNLELLELAGGQVVEFSPLKDAAPPAGINGLYIGGGYPELFALDLEANQGMRRQLRKLIGAGLPVYAECGGLMYLTQTLRASANREMVGAIQATAVMARARQSLGYVEAELLQDALVGRAGQVLRGHEFHWSLTEYRQPKPAYRLRSASATGGRLEGYADGNVLGSYVHLHFAAHPEVPANFIDICAQGARPWTAS